jgi:hypothetical protein
LTLNGHNVSSSHTITHNTNIIDFDDSMIGCACDNIGELADVYGSSFTPSLDRATDAITKVTLSWSHE